MRKRFQDSNCSVAKSLDVIGDGWAILILREAFVGTRRFVDFQRTLGIAKNILSQRLAHLEENGIMVRVDAGTSGERFEYELTPMGKDLATVLTALRQWGDRWISGRGQEPLLLIDRRTGEPVPRLRILGEDGEPLSAGDMELRPGPGASEETLARFRTTPVSDD